MGKFDFELGKGYKKSNMITICPRQSLEEFVYKNFHHSYYDLFSQRSRYTSAGPGYVT